MRRRVYTEHPSRELNAAAGGSFDWPQVRTQVMSFLLPAYKLQHERLFYGWLRFTVHERMPLILLYEALRISNDFLRSFTAVEHFRQAIHLYLLCVISKVR